MSQAWMFDPKTCVHRWVHPDRRHLEVLVALMRRGVTYICSKCGKKHTRE